MSNSFEEMVGEEYESIDNEIDLEKLELLDLDDPDEVVQYANDMIIHMIKQQRIIDKNKIFKLLSKWNRQFTLKKIHLSVKEMWMIIHGMFADYELFDEVKKIAHQKGVDDSTIRLAPDQYIETAIWLIEKYHVKRMELDGALIYFDGKCYNFKTEQFINKQINVCLPFADPKTVKNIFKYLERNCPVVKEDVFEEFSHIKCLENGMYNIQTGEFFETFNADFIVTNQIPHSYVTVGAEVTALRIIEDIIDDPNEMSVFIDFLSMCLYPDIGLYFMVIFLGGGGTGKKQLATFAKLLLGKTNVTNFSLHDISSDSTNRIAAARSMLNIDEDMSEADIKEIVNILKWITRDPFSGRSIFSFPINFTPLSRLMANTNKLFDVPDDEHAEPLYDRTHTIQLKKKFRKTDGEISDIVKKSFSDSDYDILITRVLKNATVLYQSQRVINRHSTEDEENIWNQFGNWLKKFVSTRTIKVADTKVVAHDVWLAWSEFAEKHNIPADSPRKFYKKFETEAKVAMGDVKVNDTRMNGYYGIRLLTDEEIENIEQAKLNEHE